MRVFNSDMTRSELLRRVGNLAQVGSVQLLAHEEGYPRGYALLGLSDRERFPFFSSS